MRYALVLGILFFVLPTTLYAETKYVSEIREITLRTGPGVEYKITAMVKSGTPMTVMEQSEGWTRVQIGDSKDGWVLNQFLQDKVPDGILLEKLQKTHTTLSSEAETLRSENRDLTERVDALTADLNQCRTQADTLTTTYETLKNESATFLTLQADYKSTSAKLAAQQKRADQFENELSGLYNDKRLTWIIAGACILLTGVILGLILKPQRRRSSLL